MGQKYKFCLRFADGGSGGLTKRDFSIPNARIRVKIALLGKRMLRSRARVCGTMRLWLQLP
jgi:hypothetical protein